MPVSNVAKRDSARRGDVDVLGDISDGVFSYLQEIAQTPQLTHKEERKLFEAFSASTQEISELLGKLPPQCSETDVSVVILLPMRLKY